MSEYVKINIPKDLIDKIRTLRPDLKGEKQAIIIRLALLEYCKERERARFELEEDSV